MAMTFPAYSGDPAAKQRLIQSLERADWSALTSLEQARPLTVWHKASGFPAGLLMLLDAILPGLPADRRGRFLALVFDAPDPGADLSLAAELFLSAAAERLPAGADAAGADWSLPARDCAPALARLMAAGALPGWDAAADLLVETLGAHCT